MRRNATWGTIASLTAGAALAVPLAAPASTHTTGSTVARTAAAAGTVFGGVNAQGWPVVLEMSKNGRRVVKAVSGLRLNCTSGSFISLFDRYGGLTVTKSRRFAFAFDPTTTRNDDGSTAEFVGSIAGSFNKARTKATGRWQLKMTERDAAGNVTDTCDSGSVKWSAKQ
jgi:hypothetical protein